MAARAFRILVAGVGAALVATLVSCTAPDDRSGRTPSDVKVSEAAAVVTVPSGQEVPAGWDTDTGPGRGYDLADSDYFSTAGLKTSYILNVPKLVADRRIGRQPLSDVQTQIDVGRSIQVYARSISARLGFGLVYGLFRGSIGVSFNTSTQVASDEAFMTDRAEVRKLQYFIAGGGDAASLVPYLTDSFAADVNNPDYQADRLFRTYGTHLPYNMAYGGRLSMSYLYANTGQATEAALAEAAQAEYALVSGSVGVEQQVGVSDLEQHSSIIIKSTGGTNPIDVTTIAKAAASYGPWEGTIDAGDPASLSFVGSAAYGDPVSDWALPVWDFATDPQRAKAIEAEFDRELTANSAYFDSLQAPQSYIKDIYVGAGRPDTVAAHELTVKIPVASINKAFTEDEWDLNHNSGGDFIFVGYTTTTDPSQAVTDIAVKDGPSASYSKNGVDYQSTGVDLNQGAKGDFLWLVYTHDPQAANTPGFVIGGIGVQTGSDKTGNTSVGAYWGSLPTDLNRHAGGDFVFLWYQLMRLPTTP